MTTSPVPNIKNVILSQWWFPGVALGIAMAAGIGIGIAISSSLGTHLNTSAQVGQPFDAWTQGGTPMTATPTPLENIESSLTWLHSRLSVRSEQAMAWDQFELAARRADDSRNRVLAGLRSVENGVDGRTPADIQKRVEAQAALFTDRAHAAQMLAEAKDAFSTVLDQEQTRIFETYVVGVYDRALGPSPAIRTTRLFEPYTSVGPVPYTSPTPRP